MLQKLNTVPVLGAVLCVLTAGLLVQKPNLGLASFELNSTKLASKIDDPGSKELFAYESAAKAPVKLVSALEAIERKKEKELEAKKARVASQSVAKKPVEGEIFIDTINRALPPVVERAEEPQVDILGLIRKYAAEYGANADVMVSIARCESGFNANAVSPSGSYKGIYQFVTSTWQSNRREMGLDDNPNLMFNLEEAIKTAAFKMGRDGYGAWPVCSQKAFASLALN